jgi:NADPH2:quinone reductase
MPNGRRAVAGDFADPDGARRVVVQVAAAGLHHLDLHKASGTFYTGPPPLPSVVGTDGVGRARDGGACTSTTASAPYGSMAERALVPRTRCRRRRRRRTTSRRRSATPASARGWRSTWRSGLRRGDRARARRDRRVGSVAVQAAKLLGAGRVVAADLAHERLHRCSSAAPTRSWSSTGRRPRRRAPRGRGGATST